MGCWQRPGLTRTIGLKKVRVESRWTIKSSLLHPWNANMDALKKQKINTRYNNVLLLKALDVKSNLISRNILTFRLIGFLAVSLMRKLVLILICALNAELEPGGHYLSLA